jgi:nickel-dependent lactate racemase
MQVTLAEFGLSLEAPDSAHISGSRAQVTPNLADPAEALLGALENPREFPPLRRALTPDDHVAIIVDERMPLAGRLAGTLLTYLSGMGIVAEAITLVSSAGARQAWIDALPDSVQDVRTEIHEPGNRKRLSYLASTQRGRRVYLNRTLVDADQTIVLAGCRYDPFFGVADGASQLFPALSDTETISSAERQLSMTARSGRPSAVHDEAVEVAWLLGVPFLIQVIEGTGDGVAQVFAGTADSVSEGHRLLEQRWKTEFARPAQTVIATVSEDVSRCDFEALARAALCAAHVVEPGGRIVILSRCNSKLGEGAELLRVADHPAIAARLVQEHGPADRIATLMWLEAARRASLFLLSNFAPDAVEELFATPLGQAHEAQRLLDAASTFLIIEEADKALAVTRVVAASN